MPSTLIQCPVNTWVQVNTASKIGVIEIKYGRLVLTQQSALPTQDPSLIGTNGVLDSNSRDPFYRERTYDTSLETDEFIYVYATGGDAAISVTPTGGTL